MPKQIIQTSKAPQTVGPYSQAVKVEEKTLIFTAGQIPMEPGGVKLVTGGTGSETRQALENLKAILEEVGSGLDKVIKTTVYLCNMDDFAIMNEIYSQFFPSDPPARTTVAVTKLPKGAKVEIEAIAYV